MSKSEAFKEAHFLNQALPNGYAYAYCPYLEQGNDDNLDPDRWQVRVTYY